ncbi:hypothetical protein F0562_029846 [Nyssa sinensis]|uniref:Uncharacterized protein n=1 Tax=Nyssa sinensis TaxID=561372 RepID=A0A5J5AX87_9ASTE|nr:hypothetical protein F0562_029846 [Nyssa sinensis]
MQSSCFEGSVRNFRSESAKMAPGSKRRKIDRAPPRRTAPSASEKKDTDATSMNRSTVYAVQSSGINQRIQQAKNHAVAQAKQEGCTGNFRIFDSPFGNFLVPVIPTRAEFGG